MGGKLDLLTSILRGPLVSLRTFVFVSREVQRGNTSRSAQSLLATYAQKGLFLNRTVTLTYQVGNSHVYRASLSFISQVILEAHCRAIAVVLGFPGNG